MSLLTTVQAGAILGCSKQTVCNLIRAGKLTDLMAHKRVAGRKHYAKLDSHEVQALRKTLTLRHTGRRARLTPATAAPAITPLQAPRLISDMHARIMHLEETIGQMSQRIDQLISLWS